VQVIVIGFVQENVLRLVELSASNCKRLCAQTVYVRLCADKELAWCLDLILGRRI
jgi:hypothetical protein